MSKMPIKWHEECLQNFDASLAQKRKEADRLSREIFQMENESWFRREQLRAASEKGLTEYDGERFHQKHKP